MFFDQVTMRKISGMCVFSLVELATLDRRRILHPLLNLLLLGQCAFPNHFQIWVCRTRKTKPELLRFKCHVAVKLRLVGL